MSDTPDVDHVLRRFLMEQENAPLLGGNSDWLRHPSPEGGTDTVGFGHKLTAEEDKTGEVYGYALDSLTPEQAEAILSIDIKKKRQTLDRKLRAEHGVRLDELSPRKQAMLLDYEFNLRGGIGSFPSFTGAVITGDQKKQLAEMTRYFTDKEGNTKPLARNRAFYSTFMSNEARRILGE